MASLLGHRYEVLGGVGAGGEGTVFKALDRQHGRAVALKVRLVPAGVDRRALVHEAGVLLSLSPHPGLPIVRDDFFDDGDGGLRHVMVTDWVEGIDLGELLVAHGRPGLAPSNVMAYVAQAADALAHLHHHEPPVIHGDVKPANLLLTTGGRVMLVDFGAATSLDSSRGRGQGTVGYVAPEVAAGRPAGLAADVYGLAATALALLTGRPPAGGRPAWPHMDSVLVERLEDVLGAALDVDPKRRPASAGELAERLRVGFESSLPAGVITFLLTDIVGSARLWEADTASMASVLVSYGNIVADAVAHSGGRLLVSMAEGDSTVSSYDRPAAALAAALRLQAAVASAEWPAEWPVHTRAALHTGEADRRGGQYYGPTIARTTRLRSLAEGGEVVLSQFTAELVAGELPADHRLVELGPATLGIGPQEIVHAVAGPGLQAPALATCPYRGLASFEAQDARLFFGRGRVVEAAVGHLEHSRFLAIVGPSGSGKSSLARAGIVPAVAAGAAEGLERAEVVVPGVEVGKALAGLRLDDPSLLVVVDQFEEVFAPEVDAADRQSFIDKLVAAASAVVIVVRADVYGRCSSHAKLAALVAAEQVLLGPMDEADLHEAIEGPAAAVGLRVDPGLTELLVAEVVGETAALPLLSHALAETWERRDNRTLSVAGYRAAGGIRGAVARTAEAVYGSLGDDARSGARRVILRLVEPGDGVGESRRRAPVSELGLDDPVVADVFERLVAARLVTVTGETAELAHEALLREWPRLRGWVDQDRHRLRTLRHLTASSAAWQARDRDPSELYRGARLAGAVEALDGSQLTPLEQDFLDAGMAQQEAEHAELAVRVHRQATTNRRLRRSVTVMAVALTAAIGAAGLAVVQRQRADRNAERADVSRLVAEVRALRAEHPDQARLVAAEANRIDDTVETRGALLDALASPAGLVAEIHGFDSGVNGIAFDSEGDGLVMATIDTLRAVDGARQETWRTRPQGTVFARVAALPGGRGDAVATGAGAVEVRDPRSGEVVKRLQLPDATPLRSVSVSGDGSHLAAGGAESGVASVWDLASGQLSSPALQVSPEEGGVSGLALSSDGRLVAAPGRVGEVGVWDTASGKPARAPLVLRTATAATAVAFVNGDAELIVGDASGRITRWDLNSGTQVGLAFDVGPEATTSLSVSADGRFVAAGSRGGRAVVWDRIDQTRFADASVGSDSVEDAVFDTAGRRLATATGSIVTLWELGGRQPYGVPAGPPVVALTPAFSPDGQTLALSTFEHGIELIDPNDGLRRAGLAAPATVLTVAYSPDGHHLAAGTTSGVLLWDLAQPDRPPRELEVGGAWVWDVDYSPDGRRLVVATDPNSATDFYNPATDGAAVLFDVESGQRVGQPMVPGGFSVLAVDFSPDGRLIATGSYRDRARLFDAETQHPVGQSMDIKDDGVWDVAFSPNGRRLAVANIVGLARVWDVTSQRLVGSPMPMGAIYGAGVAYSPDGSMLATSTLLGKVRLWDAETGSSIGEIPVSAMVASDRRTLPHELPGRVAFRPDGRKLAVGGVETLPMLVEIDPVRWREAACRTAGRALTRPEWVRFLRRRPYRPLCSRNTQ